MWEAKGTIRGGGNHFILLVWSVLDAGLTVWKRGDFRGCGTDPISAAVDASRGWEIRLGESGTPRPSPGWTDLSQHRRDRV